MNLVEASVDGGDIVLGQFRVPLALERRPGRDGRVILGIRPETFEDAAFASPDLPTIDAEVVVLEELGSDAHVFFRVQASRVAAGLEDDADEATDLVVDRGSLLNARVDPRTRACVGDSLRLSVDPSRFHFFDADTGLSLLDAAGVGDATPASPVAI
jgi:ABC-type sugar transport system ATPase subunit